MDIVKVEDTAVMKKQEELDFQAFLKAGDQESIYEVQPTERIKNANGEPVTFRLRTMSAKELSDIRNKHTKNRVINGKFERYVNESEIQLDMVCKSVIFPPLDDATLQDAHGAVGATDLLQKMLRPGELVDLLNAVVEINGFEAGMDDKITLVKN